MGRHFDRRARVALAATLLAPAVLLGTSTSADATPAPSGTGHLPAAASADDPDGQWWDYDRSSRSASPGGGDGERGQEGQDSGRDAQAQGFADEEGVADEQDAEERPVDSLGPQRSAADRAPERRSRAEDDSTAEKPAAAPRKNAAKDDDDELDVETPNKEFDQGAARAREGRDSDAPAAGSAREKTEDEVLAKEAEAAGMYQPAPKAEPKAKAKPAAEPKAKSKSKGKTTKKK